MELIALSRLGRGTPAVVPGPEVAVPEDATCALCSDGERLHFVVVGHVDTMVCVDSLGCVRRALSGVGV